jgi:hypothetical protein
MSINTRLFSGKPWPSWQVSQAPDRWASSGTLMVRIMKPQLAKSFLGLAITAILVGCGTPGIPLPPSLDLPTPVADLRAIRKGDKVYLAWTVPTETMDRILIRRLGPTKICRSLDKDMSTCGSPVGEAPPLTISPVAAAKGGWNKAKKKRSAGTKVTSGFVDTLSSARLPDPTREVTYAVEVLNEDRHAAGLSNQVKVPAAPTIPPPAGFKASVTADGIVLAWDAISRPSSLPELQFRYRVYRREEGGADDTLIGELPLNRSRPPQLLDHNFAWERAYEYRANVVTGVTQPDKPEIEVEGDDTGVVRVFAHDVFPPAVPEGLQATFSGVGQQPFIDLVWAPNLETDLAGYNVYRSEEGEQPAKINSELVKTPAYRDRNVESGKKYFYSVSAVDVRGNQSARSQPANEAVP